MTREAWWSLLNGDYEVGSCQRAAKVVQVILTDLRMRGDGETSPMRRVLELYTLDGLKLAEWDDVAVVTKTEVEA